MPGQLPLDHVAAADQQQTDLQVTRGDEGSVDDARGGLITPHRVDGDAQCQLPAASYQLRPQSGSFQPRLEAGSWKLEATPL